MLVLSRRPGQEIVFPALGIKMRLVRIQGNTARVGIDAPKNVEVFRAELIGEQRPEETSRSAAHELCNRLSRVTLSLHLLERLLEAKRLEEAAAVLAEASAAVGGLDRDWVMKSMAPPRTQARRCRALVVDDDHNERELLAGLLAMNGCDCRTASDGQDALDYLAANERPDFVLLDMCMPRRDGKETLQAIRAEPRWRGVKVISISPTAPEELGIIRGPDGLDDWFPKPLDPRRLWESMRRGMAEDVN
jgi:carbon storage regulator CsrA